MEWDPEYEEYCKQVEREVWENRTPRTVNTIPQRLPLPGESGARQPERDVLSLNQRCWRCGGIGHRRASCRRTAVLFCSGCGKPGVLSRNCCRRPYDPPETPRLLMSNPPPLPSPIEYSPTRSLGVQCRLLKPPAPPCPTCGETGKKSSRGGLLEVPGRDQGTQTDAPVHTTTVSEIASSAAVESPGAQTAAPSRSFSRMLSDLRRRRGQDSRGPQAEDE